MERILFDISQVIGLTIIHSLWQGLFVYFALRVILTVKISGSQKYLLALLGMVTITCWFFYTLFNEISIYNREILPAGNLSAMPLMLGIPAGITHMSVQASRYYYNIERYLPYITIAYAAGVAYNSIMLIIARKKIKNIRRSLCIDGVFQKKAGQLAAVLQIRKNVQVGLSKLVNVPCVTGFIKPVILLPFTIATSLTAQEIESILLHELAHIKRNDYVLNLALQAMRVLLFFNPFAQLIIGIINREREVSCDDIVLRSSQQPLIYAQALMKLEQMRSQQWQLALSATGKKYYLLNRIQRIMKPEKTITSARHILLIMVLFTVGIISVAWLSPTVSNGKISVRNINPLIKKALTAIAPGHGVSLKEDTGHRKNDKSSKIQFSKPVLVNADDHNDGFNSYQLFGFGDPQFDALNAEYRKHRQIVEDYRNSDTYKLLEGESHGYKHPLIYFYGNDTLTRLLTAFKQSENILKSYNEGDINNQRTFLGKNIGAYYSSAQFTTINNQLQHKYHIDPKKKYDDNDPDYQRYRLALTKKLPAGIKDQIAQLSALSDRVHNAYASREFQANVNRFNLLRDSLQAYYKRPHTQQGLDTAKRELTDEETTKYREQFEAYRNNPDIKREEELQMECAKKIGSYMSTPQFIRHVHAWKNELRTVLNDHAYDKIVHPGHGIK